MTAAIDEDVHLIVFAGDFLDNNRVTERVMTSIVDVLSPVSAPIFILPGNHDCYTPDSAYRRFNLTQALPDLRIVTSESGESLSFPALDLAIWGKPHTSYGDNSPLRNLPKPGTERWQIAVAHGHVVRGPHDRHRSYRIQPADIAATKRDYVALGHWETMCDVSAPPVLAAYSGSPQRTGEVLIVELDGQPRYIRKTI